MILSVVVRWVEEKSNVYRVPWKKKKKTPKGGAPHFTMFSYFDRDFDSHQKREDK
jgi:hypothetical protein